MGAGGLAWLRYRLDMAGVVGSNPTRPIVNDDHCRSDNSPAKPSMVRDTRVEFR